MKSLGLRPDSSHIKKYEMLMHFHLLFVPRHLELEKCTPAVLNPLNFIAVVYSNTTRVLLDLNFIDFADFKMVRPPQITRTPAEKKK